ncbi:MAG: hypothetical protein QOI55_320, partial [Actinomycetota bacterium]|nr:hypothetical protein [Actinomycetota bacterium]
MRKSFALLVLFVLFLTAVSVTTSRAAGAATNAATSTRLFALVRQPASVGPADTLPLRLRIKPASPKGLVVRVRLHNHIDTRSGFEETVAGRQLGREIDSAQVSLDNAPAGAGVVTARFGMPDAKLPSSQTLHPSADPPGVYPLEVELLAGGVPVDHFLTWLVYVPAAGQRAIAEPLSLAWVWSVVAPPAHESDGTTPDPNVLSEMAPGGRLERIASLLVLARNGKVPLTLDVSPETLQSWLTFAQERRQLDPGATALRIAANSSDNQLLAEPYVPIDLPAFERAGFGPYLADQMLAGSDTLRDLAGVRQDTRTVAVEPVDDAAIGLLRKLLFDRVLVREERLAPRRPNLTPARPFKLSVPGNATIDATSTNPTVANWLNGTESPALRAQRFLAGLSLIAMEAPNLPRGIVVATPRNWKPDRSAVAHVLSGLQQDPLVRPVTLNDYFTKVPPDTDRDKNDAPLVRQLLPSKPSSYPITAIEYQHARQSLDSFRGVVGSKDRSIALGQQALLLALSSAFTPA